MKYQNEFGTFYAATVEFLGKHTERDPHVMAQVFFTIAAKTVVDLMKGMTDEQKVALANVVMHDMGEFLGSMVTDGGLKVQFANLPSIENVEKKDMN